MQPTPTTEADRAKAVLIAIEQLPSALQRDVVRLRMFGEDGEKPSLCTIARRFNVCLDAVRTAECLAVQNLKTLLGE